MPCCGEDTTIITNFGWCERFAQLRRLWRLNWRIGWPERARGLHYWLGFEYAAMLAVLHPVDDERWLDGGTGAWSSWPYLLADATGTQIVALDIDEGLRHQHARRARAAAAGCAVPPTSNSCAAMPVRCPSPTRASTASRPCHRSNTSRAMLATVARCARSLVCSAPVDQPS